MPAEHNRRLTNPLMLQHNDLPSTGKHDAKLCCHPHFPPIPDCDVAEEAASLTAAGMLLQGRGPRVRLTARRAVPIELTLKRVPQTLSASPGCCNLAQSDPGSEAWSIIRLDDQKKSRLAIFGGG